VLSIFKAMAVPQRLATIVEGESLFNDGTAAALFVVLLAGTASGTLSVMAGMETFLAEVLGGAALGLVLGYTLGQFTKQIDDPAIEITLTTILAYSSYLAAQSLHLSGVIATVAAGLMVGNVGARTGMSARTRVALWSFWEYISFIVNSLVFLLIGLQVRIGTLLHGWRATLLAIATVILGRVLSVYCLVPFSNLRGRKIPVVWQHVLVAGGIRGALALALALSLNRGFPYRDQILALTFGVVAFTIVVQGLMIKPLLSILGITVIAEDAYELARVRQIAMSSARSELDELLKHHLLSRPAYNQLRAEVERDLESAEDAVDQLYGEGSARIHVEIEMARTKLLSVQKSAIEQAVHEGLISQKNANDMIGKADEELDRLT
jgi:CPA1 family monovalent cation:H+ antiporter